MLVRIPGHDPIELSILPIDGTKPHEDTIPELLRSIKNDVSRTGFQRDPILVDKRTGVVLDGMHRRASLVASKAKYALCATLDYNSKDIELRRWLRYFVAPDRKMIQEIVDLLQLKSVPGVDAALKSVEESRKRIALISSKGSFVSNGQEDLGDLYEKIKEVDKIANAAGVEIQVISESDKENLFTSEAVYVIYPPPLEKEDVLALASQGKLLPFKTTRHIVPIRPMGIHFPISDLIEKNQRENLSTLEEIIKRRNIQVLKAGTWYEGRMYSEPLAVFRSD